MSKKHKSKEQGARSATEESTIESDILMGAVRFSDQMLAEMTKLLSIWGMTALQYDALRVLYVYDNEGIGLPSGEVGKYLQTRVPDVTRLLDRLANKGWLTRERDKNNRRVVRAQLTQIGCELVESIHSPLKELEQKQLDHMSSADKCRLKVLLEMACSKSL